MPENKAFEAVQLKTSLGTKAMVEELQKLQRQEEDGPLVPAYWVVHQAVKHELERMKDGDRPQT